ncbi:guanine nucleotide exchange factor DBS isoform X2 [Electrophorus electricus]|uniref:guanine nucleotide exchange factor DBS isoform X2 n=1 Tax=Electrophorus electricus TaxID=8005 RepID=UPI0015D06FB7|nr:guanine nucleotide exchange factor DBS isoform X2 [Electrophorus electricus]
MLNRLLVRLTRLLLYSAISLHPCLLSLPPCLEDGDGLDEGSQTGWARAAAQTEQYEIMQQETSPLCAADIIEQLKMKFAFLSGGRGHGGSPIIIFPEFPTFNDIREQEFHNVLTYLTSVPSLTAAGVGFILVIDRRQDRWACVKGTLLRLSGHFPGNLRLVLVLRPSALLQRTLSDVFFRIHQNEFNMKVPVIMLSSVTDLHSYIDRSQLTQELGGTLPYCHKTWISQRTDVEGFAVLVKRMAHILQVLGRELAESELPDTPLATSNLLNTHSNRRETVKGDMAGALRHGRKILEDLREPVRRDPDSSLNPDQLENLAIVHRLLSQLNESLTAFDEFWLLHQNKLDKCLQLRRFEHNVQQVCVDLEEANDSLTAFPHVGMSPTHTERLLRELAYQEEKASGLLDRMKALVVESSALTDGCEYMDDTVRIKCAELQKAREKLPQDLKARRALLLQAMELHQGLQSLVKWCEDGIYLVASQPLDKCQTQEGAESALQDLEGYLETANEKLWWDMEAAEMQYKSVLNEEMKKQVQRVLEKKIMVQEMFEKRRVSLKKLAAKQTRPVQPVAPTPEAIKSPLSSPAFRDHEKSSASEDSESSLNSNQVCPEQHEGCSITAAVSEEEENLSVLRRHVMNELLETERAYVEELLCVLQGYAAEMDNPAMSALMPAALNNKKDVLFGNMQEILHFHKTIFLRQLESYADSPELVGRCFLERMGDLRIYEKYCHNKPRSESLWRQCSDCAFFQECQKKLEHKLGLDSYLLKPVQRITKYQLLLKELIKYSKGCEGSVELQAALSSLLGILKAVNDSMHLIAITGYEGNLGELGRLLMQGSFSVWAEHKRGHVKVIELARFKPMQRHLFLHERALLFCKRREESGEGYEKAPSYSFKQELSMNAIGITEHAKGDSKKFEIWSRSKDEVYTVQAASEEIKTVWVREIQKLLTGQLEACREASQHKITDQLTSENDSLDRHARYGQKNGGVERQQTEEEQRNEPSSPDGQKPARGKGSFPSAETKAKRQDIKSDPTPLGWVKGSLSLEGPVERNGFFSTVASLKSNLEGDREKKTAEEDGYIESQCVRTAEEEPKMNTDPEDGHC